MLRYLGKKVISHGEERCSAVDAMYYWIVVNSRGKNPNAFDVLVFVEDPDSSHTPYPVATKNDISDLSRAIERGRAIARSGGKRS